MQQTKTILGNNEHQYWVSYEYGNKEDLQDQLHKEFIKLYYTDRVFRTQHLNGLAQLGSKIKAKELYFDKERADLNNGFMEDKYFPRRSVDGKLQEAIIEQHKLIILLGTPGSGKTRALYQLLVSPPQWVLANRKQYALGTLSNSNIIVVHRDNISQVYQFLASENEYDSSKGALCEYYLICDQLKDVFGMLSNEDLFKFFDMVMAFKHIHMIATSIPSAFDNFRERWNTYGHKPMEDDQLTKIITIPQISSDEEEDIMRNWMQNELHGSSTAETIGDFIPQLNNYKQSIVKRLYDKIHELPYLTDFLPALQITETFRKDTALFLPVLIMLKNIEEPKKSKEFRQEIAKTLNFLIDNNVIWVRLFSAVEHQTPMVIEKMQESNFTLDPEMDSYDEFVFDGETFDETPLSTAYIYGINDIVWKKLEEEDANKHIKNEKTLLKDFRNQKSVIRAAKEFYRAFPSIISMRRILSRIPNTDCYDMVPEELWNFVYDKLKNMEMSPQSAEIEEFLTTVGMLIGRSKNLSYVEKAISIIRGKDLSPNYGIIGELYSVCQRLGKDTKKDITNYVRELREIYHLNSDNSFSLNRKIAFYDLSFNDALKVIKNEEFLSLNNTANDIKDKFEQFNRERLLHSLAKKVETLEQWDEFFRLHKQMHINLRRSTIHLYFSCVADQNKILQQGKDYESSEDLIKTRLCTLIDDFNDIIADEDKESCYFYSIDASWNFKQAHSIYQLYVEKFKDDNQRLISTVLHTVLDHEFQKALIFLIEVSKRFKEKGLELNDICFNNLIKSAPNMGEAIEAIQYMNHLQDHTLANILTILIM